MNTLANAFKNAAYTEKGALAYKSSLNKCVDLFFAIGAMRGQDTTAIISQAMAENEEVATRIMLWSRDVRGGAGEREHFRKFLQWLEIDKPSLVNSIIPLVPEIGRWDDLLCLSNKKEVFDLIRTALYVHKNSLCAKWMPRKGKIAAELARFLKLTPKQYRKLLVSLTSVVEQKMCTNSWNTIEYGKVPSKAHLIYSKAFYKHNPDGYQQYLNDVTEGKNKINASAVFPHEIITPLLNEWEISLQEQEKQRILQQWNALPNYIGNNSIIPMIDVSGSMFAGAPRAIDVAVGLGLYLAERNTGPFKDCYLTFSSDTQLVYLEGNILEKISNIDFANWGMSTDIYKAFKAVLNVAVHNNVSPSDMPNTILILSDMQFDAAVDDMYFMQAVEKEFDAAGYNVPKLVFWNISHRGNNIPVTFRQDGTALVSGYSPSIMRSILSGEEFTPEGIMLNTVMVDRYDYT